MTTGTASAAVEGAPLDQMAFRRAMSHFPTGVVVLTSITDAGPVGMTCQSFVSLSLDPPLIAVCPSYSSTSWPVIETQGRFIVNMLAESQQAVSTSFARSGTDKFAGHSWHVGPHGLPVLDESLAHIECRVQAVHPGGDHRIVVAEVCSLDVAPLEGPPPLLFFRSAYRAVSRQTA